MPWHNKVLGDPTEIFDFVLGDGSYYSLFTSLDTNYINMSKNVEQIKPSP